MKGLALREPFLSTAQTAMLLGTSLATVKRQAETGAIEAVGKKGRSWRFRPGGIVQHLRALDGREAAPFAAALRAGRLHECVAQLIEARMQGKTLEELLDEVVLPAVDAATPLAFVDRLQPLAEPWEQPRQRQKIRTAVLLDDGRVRARMATCLLRARAFTVLVPALDHAAGEVVAIVKRAAPSVVWMDAGDGRLGILDELKEAIGASEVAIVAHGAAVALAPPLLQVGSMRELGRLLDRKS